MSAKWRRARRNPKKFNVFKTFKRVKSKKASEIFQIKSHTAMRTFPRIHKISKAYGKRKLKDPVPLIDVLEAKDEIMVIAEFAGFSSENLEVHMKNRRLTLSAETLDRKYHKSLNLPTEVIPNSIHTVNKNGVLEIRLKKAKKENIVDKVVGLENAT